MAFQITMTESAEQQLRSLPARDQRIVETAIQARLIQHPTTPSQAIKQLRPNPLAAFELRAGALRVLYNVDGDEVILLVVGRKVGNKLVVAGEEFDEHRGDAAEPAGGDARDDPK